MHNIRSFKQVRQGLSVVAVLSLGAFLVACGAGTGAPGDGIDPSVQISSSDTSLTASYELTGVAVDNVGVAELQYTQGGGAAQTLVATGNTFSANLTLAPGANAITVIASDAAGNEGSDTITVDYLAPPSGVTSDHTIAARGDSIVISGDNFGASGDVTLGGMSVTADSWSDGEIALTIPADAPGGPQTVTVSSPYGDSSFDLFVGVAFEPGQLDDLVAEGHPKGTAVLLSEGTYTQTAADLVLDNLSLYGQGIDLTIVDAGGLPNTLTLLADTNQQLAVADLTLIADAVFVAPDEPGPIAPLGTASLESFDADAATLVLNELIDSSIQHYGSGSHLEVQAANTGSLTLQNLKVEDVTGGMGLITATLTATPPAVLASDVHIQNVDFAASASMLAVITAGDVTVRSSQVDSSGFAFLSLNGAIDVEDSELLSGAAAGPLGIVGMIYSDSLRVVDSSVRAYPVGLYLAPLTLLLGGGMPFPTATPVEITGSTFRMLDANPAAAPDTGSMLIAGNGGESHISNNTFIVQRVLSIGAVGGSLAMYDNEITMGHAAIATSSLNIASINQTAYLEFTANSVTWLNEGGLNVQGNFDASVHDNSFTGNGAGTAVSIEQDSSDVMNTSIQNNTFTNFLNALAIELPGAGADPFKLDLNGNHFDFPIDAAGKVAVLTDVVEATIDVDNNTWGTETNIATLNGYITEAGATVPGIMQITSVLTP